MKPNLKPTNLLPLPKVDYDYIKNKLRRYTDDIKCYTINDDFEIIHSIGYVRPRIDDCTVYKMFVDSVGKGKYEEKWFTTEYSVAKDTRDRIIKTLMTQTIENLKFLNSL